MIKFLITAFGLFILFLAFFQLRNEKRIQKEQIKRMFNNLVIKVYCEGVNAPNILFDPDATYNIISTSITCGRKTEEQKHQIDLAIDTDDMSLQTTSAVITTVATKTGLEMSISCVEQPYIIVQHANPKEDMPEFEYNLNREEKKIQVKNILSEGKNPRVAENYTFEYTDNFLGTTLAGKSIVFNPNSFEIPVSIGDKILLGNTLLVIEKTQ